MKNITNDGCSGDGLKSVESEDMIVDIDTLSKLSLKWSKILELVYFELRRDRPSDKALREYKDHACYMVVQTVHSLQDIRRIAKIVRNNNEYNTSLLNVRQYRNRDHIANIHNMCIRIQRCIDEMKYHDESKSIQLRAKLEDSVRCAKEYMKLLDN